MNLKHLPSLCCTASFLALSHSSLAEISPATDATKPPPPKNAAEQYPLNPDEAIHTFQTLPGLKVELIASEPHVVDPVSMTFDEDGRIYAAEMLDYPLIVTPGMPGPFPDGQIRLMEDRDGDGSWITARFSRQP